MRTKLLIILMSMLLSGVAISDDNFTFPMNEFSFVETFSGKNKKYIYDAIGKPFSQDSRENSGGKVEFLVYENIVNIGKTDKVYKYTQIGIINDVVETIGNTNLDP